MMKKLIQKFQQKLDNNELSKRNKEIINSTILKLKQKNENTGQKP